MTRYEPQSDGTCFVEGLGWVVQCSRAVEWLTRLVRERDDAPVVVPAVPVPDLHMRYLLAAWSFGNVAKRVGAARVCPVDLTGPMRDAWLKGYDY